MFEIEAVNDRIPEIGTQGSVEGKKEISATEVFTLEDTISYMHLIPGKEYILKGVLMDKATGEPMLIDGEEIRSEAAFIPEEPSGEIVVPFTFDSKFIKEETNIVVFENLYCDGKELAVHADINDDGQTVKIIPPVPNIPQTGDNSNLGFWLGLGAVALGGIISTAVILMKKKKDDENE